MCKKTTSRLLIDRFSILMPWISLDMFTSSTLLLWVSSVLMCSNALLFLIGCCKTYKALCLASDFVVRPILIFHLDCFQYLASFAVILPRCCNRYEWSMCTVCLLGPFIYAPNMNRVNIFCLIVYVCWPCFFRKWTVKCWRRWIGKRMLEGRSLACFTSYLLYNN
jgi:hypothetical protein